MTCSCVVIKGRMGAAADLQDPGDQLHPHLHAASRQIEHSSTCLSYMLSIKHFIVTYL